jgi:putative transposase
LGWDYARPGAYFITACAYRRRPVFGDVVGECVEHTRLGLIAIEEIQRTFTNGAGIELDAYIVMPDHVHLLIVHAGGPMVFSVARLVQQFKARVTHHGRRRAECSTFAPLWQRGFFDRIVRSHDEHVALRAYVETNPIRWSLKVARSGKGKG